VLHALLAEQLLIAATTKAPELDEFARRWYVIVCGLLHAYGEGHLSAELRDRSQARFPETVLQMNAGAAFDGALAAETRAAAAGPISGRTPAAFIEALSPDAMQQLQSAALGYERAVSIRPRFEEAALHLGRIRLIQRRYDEAERWLAVASTSESLPTRYLAAMFRGALAERHGRYDEAEKHYRAALGLFRWGQSATLALSHLLARTGKEAEARGALARHFVVTEGNVIEPLWTYSTDPSAQLREGLDLLRAEVWR
jgi:tetratricopeptide (TPR) repeat protein